MPFYEYECSSCKFYSEVMQKITDAPLTKCPSCGKKTLKKLVSAPNFRLKGSGWYETDFKSEQETKRNLADTEKAPEKAAESGEAAKSAESKPAEATPSTPAKADAKPDRKAVSGKSPARSPARKSAAARRPAKSKAKTKSRSARKARR